MVTWIRPWSPVRWLKWKYCTRQHAYFIKNCERFLRKNLPPYIVKILIQFGNLCKIILVFSKVMAVWILCYIFNPAKKKKGYLIFIFKQRSTDCFNKHQSLSVVHLKICFKCPPPALTQAGSLLGDLNVTVDRVLWPLVPHQPYNFCELVDVLQLTLKCSSQALAVQRWAAVGWYPRPFIFTKKPISKLNHIQVLYAYAL